MKTTKAQLRQLILEELVKENERERMYDLLQGQVPPPHSMGLGKDATEASMTPNVEVEAENKMSDAVLSLQQAGYTAEEIVQMVMDAVS